MASTYDIKIGSHNVTATVVNTISQLDQSLGEFLSTIKDEMISHVRPIIAVDIEKHYYEDDSKRRVTEQVAVVKLCFNETCLIIQLLNLKEPPCSLAEFFQRQELSFVGVGIKHCLDGLSRDYGITCRNAIDLGLLAATVKDEKCKSFGLFDLAYQFEVLQDEPGLSWLKDSSAVLGGWGAMTLSQQHIEAATCGAFICACVGDHLITGSGYTI